MSGREHSLQRELMIEARQDTVFSYFTDSARWAAWWGKGSTIEPTVGGKVSIRHPNGVEVTGEVVAVDPPRSIAFTYGYVAGTPIAPGGSLVRIELLPEPHGTRLRLHHEFDELAARDHHVQGWRFQLSLFANLLADHVAAGAAATVDAWFAGWAEPDPARRQTSFAAIAVPEVRFRDRFSRLDGLAELLPHVEAAQRFMPGLRLARRGELRHCQGTVLADWTATGPDGGLGAEEPVGDGAPMGPATGSPRRRNPDDRGLGAEEPVGDGAPMGPATGSPRRRNPDASERGRGTNVFTLDADGRIVTVTGLWDPPASA